MGHRAAIEQSTKTQTNRPVRVPVARLYGPASATIVNDHLKDPLIRLKNFRNWTTEHWGEGVALKPITLVLGRNSAGKTSILQPLRLLKQTIEATDAGTHLLLDGTKVDGVDLGAFSDVVHNHEVREAVGVGFDVLEKNLSVDIIFREVNERPLIDSEKIEVTRTPRVPSRPFTTSVRCARLPSVR